MRFCTLNPPYNPSGCYPTKFYSTMTGIRAPCKATISIPVHVDGGGGGFDYMLCIVRHFDKLIQAPLEDSDPSNLNLIFAEEQCIAIYQTHALIT